MDRNYLKGREGDRINAILAAGYNFGLLRRWLAELLRAIAAALFRTRAVPQADLIALKPRSSRTTC
jgi:hypothetical protein